MFAMVAVAVSVTLLTCSCGTHKEEDGTHKDEDIIADVYYDDVVRCMQGDWYTWEESGARTQFSIDGTRVTVDDYIPPNLYNSTSNYVTYGKIKTTDSKGELNIVDNDRYLVKSIYYKYDENTDSLELTCNGIVLERNDTYANIKNLIQGNWEMENNDKKYHFTFENTEFVLRCTYDSDTLFQYTGEVEINRKGKLILSCSEADNITINYEYDENTDSIILTTSKGDALEKQ